jgi:glucose/arabinose dehydrogenase
MKTKITFALLVLAGSLHACKNESTPGDAKTSGADTLEVRENSKLYQSENQNFYIDTLSTDLENPWGLTWLPDGRTLITERSGKVILFNEKDGSSAMVKNVPAVYAEGQGGMLDITLHPKFAENKWIYLTYAKPGPTGGSTTLARVKLEGDAFVGLEELYQTHPIVDSKVHFGSRIVFDNDGYLYFSAGERGTKENAQNLKVDHGKVFRLNDDGSIPEDNPFVNTPGAKKAIWTYGNRNPQGLAYDRDNNILYEVEHGPQGGDELNILEKGKNYGWPVITYGIDYNGDIISDLTEKEGMEQPIHYWKPSIATCGMLFVTGDRYPNWKGNLLVGALARQHVSRVVLDGTKVSHEEKLLENHGRVRQVGQSPDGYIYVITEGPGQLLKLIPAK